jgi:hypothetical protein
VNPVIKCEFVDESASCFSGSHSCPWGCLLGMGLGGSGSSGPRSLRGSKISEEMAFWYRGTAAFPEVSCFK